MGNRGQCFSNLLCIWECESLGMLWKCRFSSPVPGEGPETAFLINPPGDVVHPPHWAVRIWGAVEKLGSTGSVSPWWAPFAFQNEMLEEGHEYAVMLYTWRSCSRAIPQVRQSCRDGGATTLHFTPILKAEFRVAGAGWRQSESFPWNWTLLKKYLFHVFYFESGICWLCNTQTIAKRYKVKIKRSPPPHPPPTPSSEQTMISTETLDVSLPFFSGSFPLTIMDISVIIIP